MAIDKPLRSRCAKPIVLISVKLFSVKNLSSKNKITGIVLAGGKDCRMGSEKGLVFYRGKRFVQYSLDALSPIVSQTLIISDNPAYDRFEGQRIEDDIKEAGPLAGIYSGLIHAPTKYSLVLGCDMPLISTFVLQKLIAQIRSDRDAVQFKVGNRPIPLVAVYHRRCAPKFLVLLNRGERQVERAVEALRKVETLELEEGLGQTLLSINTKEELKSIQ